jgi:hypothetical protein
LSSATLYGTPEKSCVDFILIILQKVTLQHSTAHATRQKKQQTRQQNIYSSVSDKMESKASKNNDNGELRLI